MPHDVSMSGLFLNYYKTHDPRGQEKQNLPLLTPTNAPKTQTAINTNILNTNSKLQMKYPELCSRLS